jgi:hypothetical protein
MAGNTGCRASPGSTAKAGKYRRLNRCTLTPTGYTASGGYRFSTGWKDRHPGIKDEEYAIVPKMDGMFNLFFFELLAETKNKDGKVEGFSFVEPLPGVLNDKLHGFRAFRKV